MLVFSKLIYARISKHLGIYRTCSLSFFLLLFFCCWGGGALIFGGLVHSSPARAPEIVYSSIPVSGEGVGVHEILQVNTQQNILTSKQATTKNKNTKSPNSLPRYLPKFCLNLLNSV